MKAAVYEGKEQLPVKDVPDPVLNDGEVLLKIEACLICGTDRRTYRNGDKKIPEGRIMGHEFCGTIVESRANGKGNVQVGDRVVMYIVIPCGVCRYCKMGRPNLCVSRTTMAYHHDGAFAELMKVPAKAVENGHLFKVAPDMSPVHMSVAEPLGCVINAHGRLQIGLKDRVTVIGAGPIGILHAIVSRLQGAQQIFILDTSERRLELAKAFDIDAVIKVEENFHIERVQDLTEGLGTEVVIVACSSAAAQADALEIAAKAGRVEFFGGLPKSKPTAVLNTNHLHYKEITITGSFSEKMSDFQASQALIQSGRFPADKIVTHKLPLERITEAFTLMETGEALKTCIIPN